eukprot:364873-Chlamydomonas_euryale.AAC.3
MKTFHYSVAPSSGPPRSAGAAAGARKVCRHVQVDALWWVEKGGLWGRVEGGGMSRPPGKPVDDSLSSWDIQVSSQRLH